MSKVILFPIEEAEFELIIENALTRVLRRNSIISKPATNKQRPNNSAGADVKVNNYATNKEVSNG